MQDQEEGEGESEGPAGQEEEQHEEEGESAGPAGQEEEQRADSQGSGTVNAATAKHDFAAGTALPSDDDDFDEEEEVSYCESVLCSRTLPSDKTCLHALGYSHIHLQV